MTVGQPLALYVHVPFCARACPYCDFDFEVDARPDVSRLLDGLMREVDARGIGPRPPVRTLYIGGGTPSTLGATGLAALMHWLGERFDLLRSVERTVELNPEHVDRALLDRLVAAGVDRVSLGVQSLGAEALVQLGRAHRGAQARRALSDAVAAGLRVSADLIVGWPGQTSTQLRADLEGIVATGVDHVSVYALTIEPGTPWPALVRRGRRQLPDADHQAERSREAAGWLLEAGFEHYEVASYARPGSEAQHNTAYWRWQDYLGLGPSAASAEYAADGSVRRRTNARGVGPWSSDPPAQAQVETLDAVAAAAEGAWLGLRLLDGFFVDEYLARFSAVDRAWLQRRADPQVSRGNLEWTEDGRLRVVPSRWLWHDEIAGALLVDPS